MVVTLDFETYYTQDYSLSKMSTEAYIRDERFEVIGVGIAVGKGDPTWHTGDDIATALHAIDWSKASVLCWNTAFDGAILGWRYGLYPALYLDAMGVARAQGAAAHGASLKTVAERLGVGAKGSYVVDAKGKRANQFTPQELAEYGEYCKQDVSLTRKIFQLVSPGFPHSEHKVQDLMLRMFIEPTLHFDKEALVAYRQQVVQDKWQALVDLARQMGVTVGEQELPTDLDYVKSLDLLADGALVAHMKPVLNSNLKFAEFLRSQGVEPPTKISPTTGESTYAFAKTDAEFLELQESDNPVVVAAVSARLGTKSSIEETRAATFLEIAERGAWPVAYNYWAAVSSRFSGGGDANPQNLKRRGKLRDAILPPPGHAIVVVDASQIECRLVNYIAGQEDVIETFRRYDAGEGPDVYCVFASKIYNRTVTVDDKRERDVGKVGELSLGYGGGKNAYKKMLFAQAKIPISVGEAERVVSIYRESHPAVAALWRRADMVLNNLASGIPFTFDSRKILGGDEYRGPCIALPSGAYLHLADLKRGMTPEGARHFTYLHRKKTEYIYGAMLVAICIQALARLVMTDAMLRIAPRYRVAMMTHDELVAVVPLADVPEAREFMHAEMTRPLPWAPGLPLACSVGSGLRYGEAK